MCLCVHKLSKATSPHCKGFDDCILNVLSYWWCFADYIQSLCRMFCKCSLSFLRFCQSNSKLHFYMKKKWFNYFKLEKGFFFSNLVFCFFFSTLKATSASSSLCSFQTPHSLSYSIRIVSWFCSMWASSFETESGNGRTTRQARHLAKLSPSWSSTLNISKYVHIGWDVSPVSGRTVVFFENDMVLKYQKNWHYLYY